MWLPPSSVHLKLKPHTVIYHWVSLSSSILETFFRATPTLIIHTCISLVSLNSVVSLIQSDVQQFSIGYLKPPSTLYRHLFSLKLTLRMQSTFLPAASVLCRIKGFGRKMLPNDEDPTCLTAGWDLNFLCATKWNQQA